MRAVSGEPSDEPSDARGAPGPSERAVRAHHDRAPGVTRRGFARGGSYDRLAARIPPGARVLELGCGDGALLARVPGSIGVDVSGPELALARRAGRAGPGALVQGRAQALPVRAGAFDVVAAHLALMLLDDAAAVAAELARVLAPGGRVLAVMGGGPTAAGDDAFHRFVRLVPRGAPRLGDPRLRTEAGWRGLLEGWAIAPWERWELDLGGAPDDVWALLGGSYEVPAGAGPALRAAWDASVADLVDARGHLPCRAVVFLAEAVRP